MSVPIFHKQKIPDIAMFDAVAAHVQLIHRDDIFGEVVAYTVVDTELTVNGLFRCKKIGDLYIDFFITVMTDEIYLFILGFANGNSVSAAEQFHADDIFKYQIYITHITAEYSFTYTMIGYIVLFV